MSKLIDIAGQRFGRLVAIEHPFKSDKWVCRCDCGNTTHVAGYQLRRGAVQSCGCLNRELAAARKRTHGMAGTPEYVSWSAAKVRCFKPNAKRYTEYGGRGITMCDEWRNSFEAFYRDMGPRPSIQHTLDRIDVNGHYEPGNVRWATAHQQANNARSNRRLTLNGVTKTQAEWARSLGISYESIKVRIKTWGVERALSQPKRRW